MVRATCVDFMNQVWRKTQGRQGDHLQFMERKIAIKRKGIRNDLIYPKTPYFVFKETPPIGDELSQSLSQSSASHHPPNIIPKHFGGRERRERQLIRVWEHGDLLWTTLCGHTHLVSTRVGGLWLVDLGQSGWRWAAEVAGHQAMARRDAVLLEDATVYMWRWLFGLGKSGYKRK